MATFKHLLLVFGVLVSSTLILAQDSSSASSIPDSGSSEIPVSTTGLPQDGSSTPHMASSAAGLYGHFPLSNFKWDLIPGSSIFGGNSREKRASDYIVLCNFLKEGFSLCTSCNTVRRCFPFNIGLEFKCEGNQPYCQYGRCSEVEGSLCPSPTTTTFYTTESTSTTATSF
ncbi:unnamed protein product [Chrysodeixis includens]|uniref:Uncharacterized protein n=1 Tax=Chrysodeixis includens TaxID=689277 RepID=A0A9N8KWH5_CHRIL|nr:unnamed protein product [Chrysodeixis includens]